MANASFHDLTIEQKRNHIWNLFSPIINKTEDWKRYLEIFVLWASDEKLNNFYDAMMSWDKEYLSKLINDIKSKKWEIKNLKTEFSIEVMKYEENKEKHTTEQQIDEQLGNI
jgi:hypothetical protein